MKFKKGWKLLLHILGFSCLAGAVFLQILVFADILCHGYFIAVEQNPAILIFEIFFAGYGFLYFLYHYQRFLHQMKGERESIL